MIPVDMEGNEMHNENWQDLLGIYQDLLQEETLNLNVVQDSNVVQDLNPTPMQPTVQISENHNWIASTTTRNLDLCPSPNLYHGSNQASNAVSWNLNPSPSPSPYLYHGSNQAPNSVSRNLNLSPSPYLRHGLNQASNSVSGNLNPSPSPSPSPYLYHGSNQTSNPVSRNLNPSPSPNPSPYLYRGSNQASNSVSWNLNPDPSPNLHHGSNQTSNSVSAFHTNDLASCDLLETIMGIEKSSVCVSSTIGAQNNNVNALKQTLMRNPSMQVERNWAGSVSPRSMRGSQQMQTLTSNQVIGNGYNSNQLPADGFPVPCRPCYDLNSPARSELDAASSSIVGYFPFAPITPDSQVKHMNGFSVEVTPTLAKNRHENQMVSIRSENADNNHYNEVLQTIGDSSSSVISTIQKECIVSEVGEEQGIDLNKTPQQKTPARRKKHRPKVVREVKPKKTPKVKDPNETPVKRKYVKKQGTSNLETQNGNGVDGDVISPDGGPQSVGKRKYVRKKGVDKLESQPKSGVDENPEKSCKKRLDFDLESVNPQEINLNVNPQETEQEQRINNILETSTLDMNNKYIPTTPLAKSKEHSLNVLARSLTMRKSIAGEDSLRNGYNPVNQHVNGGEIGNIILQSNTASTDLERRGTKRQSFEQMHPRNMNAMDSFLMYQKMSLNNNLGSIFLENHKKNKTQSEIQALEDRSRQEVLRKNGIYGNGSALELLKSCIGRVNSSTVGQSQNVDNHHFQPSMAATQNLQKHQVSSGMQSNMERLIAERSQRSITAMISWNPPPATPPKASRSAVVPYPATLLQKKQTAKPNSTIQRLNGSSEGHQRSSTKAKGRARKQNSAISVDDITYLLEGLHIYNEHEREQNALVPYRGANAIIPFEPIKKRKPRAKVDLDPETDRLWKLLMGKDGGESTETLDKDKEKWWENERQVFRGRADSFIARMHLVQGDRRFSRWKGSVVDSVIGVFLTQNVSDHLSSSAFMSLAAKFPLKSTTNDNTCCQDGVCVVVEEPIEIVEPNISVKGHEEIIISQDSFDSSTIQTVDEIRSSAGSNSEAEDQTTEKPSMFKELFSHDNWSTPLSTNIHHLSKFPEHNMQIPNMGIVNNLNISSGSTSNIFLPQESLASSNRNMTPGLQNEAPLFFDLFGGESISSLPSSGMTEAYHAVNNITYEHNEIPRFQAPPLGQYEFNSRQNLNNNHQEVRDFFKETREHPEALVKGKYGAQRQNSINADDRISVVDKEKCHENTAAEANSKGQNYASQVSLGGQGTNVSKARKAATEDEKKRAFDWDSLRKQVLLNDKKSERRKDATDSLDYEALRRAHVSEIADAIRERGMNNMLADRIQDFLNRLVRDHGSIDLEWLRDVPPDKAKDYLLSIRGLGLKSVECVRLLTLHHLAFPVDTNVGRIAVRLGWVPLQPLPESLQLHLLEMYPVLESIQKYLWPRLCNLDQLTLYELHYQMITFGKVFCTKSKPNCNACPMRAECRHFASAFASARLALPGPEEKRIVTSNAPIATNTIPPMPSIPLPLPPAAENDYNKDTRLFGRDCAPIIEEPSTPEPETAELSISDIEDQYYEDDHDEIPTIKLNMEEFTTNLQNIMQDNMELQGDMSKALVALNPEAASIPTPKLKNVSRLRTEHQVYELPDSHPLLEGLGKREVDDPSPYLLAIWTPGETANSVQTFEERCPDQELGKLCDRTTCFSCNSIKEANSQVVRGTILIPCRTAMRGSFPLNGTYFQVNEMFADHASSLNPIDVPRSWIWNLPRRTVYFGTSVSTIFKGLTTEGIQYCFWRGFVCVRGFDQKTRAPRPLMARLHFPASKLVKTKNESK